VIIRRQLREDLLLDADEIVSVDTDWGEVPMALVEEHLAVAWRCNGEVLWVARTDGSELEWVDPASLARDLSFAAVKASIDGPT
jgi:hypothetical protein